MNPNNLPQHIAIIMDGNGRWARQKGLPRVEGHRRGMKSIDVIVSASVDLGIKVLTLYAFSIENWSRPKREVMALMELLERFLDKELPRFMKYNIKLMAIGRLKQLPQSAYSKLKQVMEMTSKNTGLILNLALSYGGRSEITDAVRTLCRLAAQGKIKPQDINEEVIASHLYTADLPDPDLLIRTSGELRVSNFLLWQISYTELYITPVLWPDFSKEEFLKAIEEYQKRDRRFGKVKDA